MFAARPTTPAGLLAMIDLFLERELNNVSEPLDSYLLGIFTAVRRIVEEKA